MKGRFRWFRLVECKDDGDWVKALHYIDGTRQNRLLWKTLWSGVGKDMKSIDLSQEYVLG